MSFAWHEIRDHLMQSLSTLGFQRSFDLVRHAQGRVAPFRDPVALLDGLHHGPGDPDEKNLIIRAMVKTAQGHGLSADCALTVLLLALWPGLDAIRRRSIWRKIGTADEVSSDVLARSIEAIRSLDLGRVNRIATTILRNVERDMIRARQRDAARERLSSDIAPDDLPAVPAGRQASVEDALLKDDLRKVIGADAGLVIRVALEGYTQAEIAVELALSEAAARKRFQRASKRLRGFLQEAA